jgi:CRISPR-associated protein Cmr2
LNQFVQLEGDWLYRETYDALAADIDAGKLRVNRDKVEKAQKALNSFLANLENCRDIPEPSKYFALFRMDGDSIGKIISSCDADEHRELSRAMGDFCQNAVTNAIEKENLGKVVYFGGDEGLALVSVRDFLPAMQSCATKFRDKLKPWKATASVGAVIAHHQQNLTRVLDEAAAALKRAKELPDKDAFCVAILKRSGAPMYSGAKWFYEDFDVVAYLDFLRKLYLDDKLSDIWWYQLSREEWGLKTIDEGSGKISFDVDFARLETARLLSSHLKKGHVSRDETRQLTEGIGLLLKGMRSQHQSWEEFIALTGLASFIARGGGR